MNHRRNIKYGPLIFTPRNSDRWAVRDTNLRGRYARYLLPDGTWTQRGPLSAWEPEEARHELAAAVALADTALGEAIAEVAA